jgi:ferrous iron transport protein B
MATEKSKDQKSFHPTPMTYALVGNPNSGKTTLFNALTGLKQKIGNYPGVTVERKVGECFLPHGNKVSIIDLPGAYSLNARSPDEAVLRDVLLGRRTDTRKPDRIIIILDGSNLERHLYLTTQILELGIPCILVINMMDVAETQGIKLNLSALSGAIGGLPVIPMQASHRKGLVELKHAMSLGTIKPSNLQAPIPEDIRQCLAQTWKELHESATSNKQEPVILKNSLLEPLYMLSDHNPTHSGSTTPELEAARVASKQLDTSYPGWEDTLITARYKVVHGIIDSSVQRPDDNAPSLTDRLDTIFLHPVWGWATLLMILGLLFAMIFKVAEGPMEWIEACFEWSGNWVAIHMGAGDLRDLLVDGVIAGVGGVVIFLPQILILFFFIGMMEHTGYMARIAFMMDRMMSRVGLNGKSFLPLLSSHACAVPAVMATRTIDNPKDRLITILVAPLAGCSARLPVYLLMIATLVPSDQIPLMTKVTFLLLMYALGLGGAFFFAWIFHKGLLQGEGAPMILELPAYKRPVLTAILWHMWERTWLFIRRAGTVILGISILLWATLNYPKHEAETPSGSMEKSLAGQLGKFIEPVIEPMGYDWKIGIGLIASFAAREVFVSTMSIIYSVEESDTIEPLRDRLRSEKRPDGTPVYTARVCLSLMVFYVFAMQCLSTVAVVRRETNSWKWPLFQMAYTTLTACVGALLVYQIGGMLGFA